MTGSPCSPSSRIPLPSRSSGTGSLMTSTGPSREPTLAGRCHNKAQFIEATFTRLAGQAVPGGVKLEVTHLYVDGDTTIAELHSTSTTKEGADFTNDYCWVCRFDGDVIVEVRAHVDSMMVAYTILRNEDQRW